VRRAKHRQILRLVVVFVEKTGGPRQIRGRAVINRERAASPREKSVSGTPGRNSPRDCDGDHRHRTTPSTIGRQR